MYIWNIANSVKWIRNGPFWFLNALLYFKFCGISYNVFIAVWWILKETHLTLKFTLHSSLFYNSLFYLTFFLFRELCWNIADSVKYIIFIPFWFPDALLYFKFIEIACYVFIVAWWILKETHHAAENTIHW